MNAIKFNKWKDSCFFTTDDIAEIFEISPLLVKGYENEEIEIPAVIYLASEYVTIIRRYHEYADAVKFSSSLQKRHNLINDIKGKLLTDKLSDSDKQYISENHKGIRSWLNLTQNDYI